MSSPTPKLATKKADLSMKDLLDLIAKDIMLELNCHAIGTIQSFDPVKQTCTATINYKKTFFFKNDQSGNYEPVYKTYPILIDCPVIVLGGGAWALTFPITVGDECSILFNDRDIDNWFASGQMQAPATNRLHSFSDGIVLVGLRNSTRVLGDYDTARAVLRSENAMVGVGETLIKIANNSTTLNTLLQDLLTAIQALTVVCAAPGNPSSVPVNAADFAMIATNIAGLLE